MDKIFSVCLAGVALAVALPAWGQEVPPDPPPADAPAASPTPSPTPAPAEDDAALLQELEDEMKPQDGESPPAVRNSGAPPARRGGAFSNVYNPMISLNGLFTGAAGYPSPDASVAIQEVELQFTANVDPYFRADLILALPEGEGIEVEEGYVVPAWQPAGFSLRLGKIKAPFGRENIFHTHALPFVDKSLVGEALLGDEGLNEVSGEVSWLGPLPWYSLVTVSLLNGDNDELFASERADDFAGLAALKNVFDFGDDATLEVGASYAAGNNVEGPLTSVYGGHLVFKWRPTTAASTRSAVVAVEGLYSNRPVTDIVSAGRLSQNRGGFYAYAQWQLAKRWYVGGRYDYVGIPNEDGMDRRGTALLVFVPSEFSALRLQTSGRREPGSTELQYEAVLQLNITIGGHPAHVY